MSVVAVAVVTGAVFGLDRVAPVLSLGVLYLFAVLPVAVFFGLATRSPVSVVSMLAFNFFFLPPLHTLALTDSGNWVALAVFVVTAVVVSELAHAGEAPWFGAAEADALRSSDAVKTAVLHAVSHDLRSPLTAIRVASEGLESGSLALGERDRAELLETIRLETARLERLVANLLDLSRLEAGAARRAARALAGRRARLPARSRRSAPTRRGSTSSSTATRRRSSVDAAQLERVLVNVLENALGSRRRRIRSSWSSAAPATTCW